MRNCSAASPLQVRLKTGNLYSIEEFQTSNWRVRCASFHPIHSNVLACGLRDFNRVIVFKGPDSSSSSALTKWEANCHLIVGESYEFVTSVEWNVSTKRKGNVLSFNYHSSYLIFCCFVEERRDQVSCHLLQWLDCRLELSK
jgi:hypothetical protein